MWKDFQFAWRQLRKSPGFAAVVVAALALGIGANTAIFSLINTSFLHELPYPQPERLLFLSERSDTSADMTVSYPNFLDWQSQQTEFAGLAIFGGDTAKLKTPGGAEQIGLGLVSSNFFSVLGIGMAQGRGIEAGDDRPGEAPVAWLTHESWQRYFGGNPNLLGSNLEVDGKSVVVAGILPQGFRFIREADLYLTMGSLAEARFLMMRENHNGTYVIGRLRPGATKASAQTQMNLIAQRLQKEYPKANAGIGITVSSMRERIAGGARTQFLLLLGAVGAVLLIACVNVANMLLAKSVSRQREMAIRTALGASRPQLIRQLLAESILLAGLGGLAGLLAGTWGCQLIGQLLPWEVRNVFGESARLDLRLLCFLGGVTLLTGVGFGLAPAVQLSGINPVDAMKNQGRTGRCWFGRFRLSDGLVAGQVALALMLLVGAGLLIRSLHQLARIDPGFQPERILTLRVTSPPIMEFQQDPFVALRHNERILDAVRTLPAVEAAAFGTALPFSWNYSTMGFYLEGVPVPEPGKFPSANSHFVTSGYFRAMGIPLLRGRTFNDHERQPVVPPGGVVTPETLPRFYQGLTLDAVVSQRMAEQFWPGQDALGKRFRLGFPDMQLPWVEIVGVVGNTRQESLDQGETTEFYLTQRQLPLPVMSHLIVRSRIEPEAVVAAVRKAIQTAVPDQPIFDVRTLAARVDDSMSNRRFQMRLYAGFAGVALLLATLGVYGVISFTVSQRTREVGIRMALGARRANVLRDVLGHAFGLVLPGLTLGLLGAWGLSQVLQSQLFAVGATDVGTYCIGALVLVMAALAACLVPARRAANVDPMVALRCD